MGHICRIGVLIMRLTKRKGINTYINEDTIPRTQCLGELGVRYCEKSWNCPQVPTRKCPVLRVVDKLADLEDKIENGTLIEKTADLQEVKHGKWGKEKWHKTNQHICSLCHKTSRVHPESVEYKYCPYCGAKMDGDNNAE